MAIWKMSEILLRLIYLVALVHEKFMVTPRIESFISSPLHDANGYDHGKWKKMVPFPSGEKAGFHGLRRKNRRPPLGSHLCFPAAGLDQHP
jgi:hypothetical protein